MEAAQGWNGDPRGVLVGISVKGMGVDGVGGWL
jgi:hypothetical protein